MRAEDTLQYMADFYPDLFPTRKHALDHLFCIVGNGYDWIDGELVDTDDVYARRYKLIDPIEKAEFRNEESWNYEHKRWKELKELYGDVQIPMKYQFEWYPLSTQHSYLYVFPDDIKPGWKAILEECKNLLIEDGIEV